MRKLARAMKTYCPECDKTYTHLRVGECCSSCGFSVPVVALPDDPDEVIEIRCLWQRTDYGSLHLYKAARGYGGRTLGSYQDSITDDEFAEIRDHEREVNPHWPLVESVVK